MSFVKSTAVDLTVDMSFAKSTAVDTMFDMSFALSPHGDFANDMFWEQSKSFRERPERFSEFPARRASDAPGRGFRIQNSF
jgi:hypothetical protein